MSGTTVNLYWDVSVRREAPVGMVGKLSEGWTLKSALRCGVRLMADKTIEIVGGRERRRRWSVDEKLRIVAATYEPGACVRQVAASHDLYPGLLFAWRRQVREGMLMPATMPVFLPVRAITATPPAPLPTVRDKPASSAPGQIEVELRDGSRVRFDGSVSLASLRRVIAALRG